MANVNDTYFNGLYKDVWKTIIPAELTVKEVDFMLSYFNLQPGSRVLDLMCGYGRHAIALAKKGMAVTAVDNLSDYTHQIRAVAETEQLPVKVIEHDVLTYKIDASFDLAICMGNSLNFFNADDTVQLLKNISQHLVQGGHLLINTWSLAEIVFRNFVAQGEKMVGGINCINESKILFQPTRMETETTLVDAEGNRETKPAIDYIFSINEIDSMLNQAGLALQEIYSIPGRKKFALGEPRAYIAASKR